MKAFPRRVVRFMLRNRQRTLLIFLISVVGYELIETLIVNRIGPPASTIFGVIKYFILIPAAAWLLLVVLDYYETERDQATFDKTLQTEFSQQLGDARSWEELTRRIVEWPHRVSVVSNATLYVHDPRTKCLKAECACDWQGLVTVKPASPPEPDTMPISYTPGQAYSGSSTHGELHYNLPIFFNEQQIGVLKLEYPADSVPDRSEMRVLKSSLPLVGLALEAALLQNLATQQAEASQYERQQIAQHLHDTLAQNISYLRLKLDQLTGENAIREIGVVLQELERMRSSADEAYQQVRSTLDELNLNQGDDLVDMVQRQAQVISERAGFRLRVSQTGTPYHVPSSVSRQIVYITREALHNVEKHANASSVQQHFLWLENELIVKISDDGVGFYPPAQKDGHYGLWIMQQRAQDIGGTVTISNAGERGTEVTVWVPRADAQSNSTAQVKAAALEHRRQPNQE